MTSDGRLDPALDRTAREAVTALATELAAPIAREVNTRVGRQIEVATEPLLAAAEALRARSESLEQLVAGFEGQLSRRLATTVEEASERTAERLSTELVTASADKVSETLRNLVGELRAELRLLRTKTDDVAGRIDTISTALTDAKQANTGAIANVEASTKSRSERLATSLHAQAVASREIARRVDALEDHVTASRASLDGVGEWTQRASVDAAELRSILVTAEQRSARAATVTLLMRSIIGLLLAALLWKWW